MRNSEQRGEIDSATDALAGLLAEKLAPLVAHELSGEVAALISEKLAEVHKHAEAGPEVMAANDAAAFLSISRHAFNRIAPELPRCRISDRRYVYLRDDLRSWLEAKREAPARWEEKGPAEARGEATKRGPRQRVQRLV